MRTSVFWIFEHSDIEQFMFHIMFLAVRVYRVPYGEYRLVHVWVSFSPDLTLKDGLHKSISCQIGLISSRFYKSRCRV